MNEYQRLESLRAAANEIIGNGLPVDVSTPERLAQANRHEGARCALNATSHLGHSTAWGRNEIGALEYAEGVMGIRPTGC